MVLTSAESVNEQWPRLRDELLQGRDTHTRSFGVKTGRISPCTSSSMITSVMTTNGG